MVFLTLLVLFIGLPFVEVMILFQASDAIGGWNTIALVLLTGLVGAHYARQEGHRVWLKLRKDLQFGVLPADSLVHAVLIFLGGFLLITPGFISDFIGLSLVFGPSRTYFVYLARAFIEKAVRSGKIKVQTYGNQGFSTVYEQSYERPVYEAQVIDLEKKKQERSAPEISN